MQLLYLSAVKIMHELFARKVSLSAGLYLLVWVNVVELNCSNSASEVFATIKLSAIKLIIHGSTIKLAYTCRYTSARYSIDLYLKFTTLENES